MTNRARLSRIVLLIVDTVVGFARSRILGLALAAFFGDPTLDNAFAAVGAIAMDVLVKSAAAGMRGKEVPRGLSK